VNIVPGQKSAENLKIAPLSDTNQHLKTTQVFRNGALRVTLVSNNAFNYFFHNLQWRCGIFTG
jgi:hypothetical protein